jgi:hypothetical protein
MGLDRRDVGRLGDTTRRGRWAGVVPLTTRLPAVKPARQSFAGLLQPASQDGYARVTGRQRRSRYSATLVNGNVSAR